MLWKATNFFQRPANELNVARTKFPRTGLQTSNIDSEGQIFNLTKEKGQPRVTTFSRTNQQENVSFGCCLVSSYTCSWPAQNERMALNILECICFSQGLTKLCLNGPEIVGVRGLTHGSTRAEPNNDISTDIASALELNLITETNECTVRICEVIRTANKIHQFLIALKHCSIRDPNRQQQGEDI